MPKPKITPVRDKATAYPDGRIRGRVIRGLNIKPLRPIEDHRGHIVEMFRTTWGLTGKPLVYAYQVTLRSKSIRGWVTHRQQEDRIFISRGTLQWAFYDDRTRSRTRGLLNVFTFSEQNRVIFVIPPGVYHAVKNIGESEAVFINLPSVPYNHDNPDKYRLPITNDLIPFDFGATAAR